VRLCLIGIRGDILSQMREMDSETGPVFKPNSGICLKGPQSDCDEADNDDDSSSNSAGRDSSDDETDQRRSVFRKNAQNSNNNRQKWTKLDEMRLQAYVSEDKPWNWIARELGRKEGAVRQHWKLMQRVSKT